MYSYRLSFIPFIIIFIELFYEQLLIRNRYNNWILKFKDLVFRGFFSNHVSKSVKQCLVYEFENI